MEMVERAADHVSVKDAMRLAGVSDKTIRLALQRGTLPRRYIMMARGPQLVFTHAELAGWLAERTTRPRRAARTPTPTPAVGSAASTAALHHLEDALAQSRADQRDLAAQMAQHREELGGLRAAIASLAAQIAALQAAISDLARWVSE